MGYFILKDKVPVEADFETFAEFMNNSNNRRVKETTIKDIWISTVFLGIDHNWSGDRPLLFETMTFVYNEGNGMDRCSTWSEAELMHEKMCQRVKNHLEASGYKALEIIDRFINRDA